MWFAAAGSRAAAGAAGHGEGRGEPEVLHQRPAPVDHRDAVGVGLRPAWMAQARDPACEMEWFEAIAENTLEAAATLRPGPLDRFFTVALPLARPGLLTACVLGFAHTVGEFGVVLMVGGNIPGSTRVLSVAIYDHVEALEYADAHRLSAFMLVFSFTVLVTLYLVNRAPRTAPPPP